ncbi:hypothetical protein YA0871_21065 [Pseudomonas paralactis]|uniref:Uncharacterized protein n=1 Tax=Pseudomonas paralactis TaxID=1615673 RepID=A0ABS0V4C7_9PSED|nr:hypothetical protein [Pseudomonas paralactis]MBI6635155.1 hypothetical protein [Pseudomonas paralactis]
MNRSTALLASNITSDMLVDAGVFISAVSGLIVDDVVAQDDEGGDRPLNSYRIDGLMRGLAFVADVLSERGAWLKQQVEEEEARAALARRKGETTLDSTNIGEQS